MRDIDNHVHGAGHAPSHWSVPGAAQQQLGAPRMPLSTNPHGGVRRFTAAGVAAAPHAVTEALAPLACMVDANAVFSYSTVLMVVVYGLMVFAPHTRLVSGRMQPASCPLQSAGRAVYGLSVAHATELLEQCSLIVDCSMLMLIAQTRKLVQAPHLPAMLATAYAVCGAACVVLAASSGNLPSSAAAAVSSALATFTTGPPTWQPHIQAVASIFANHPLATSLSWLHLVLLDWWQARCAWQGTQHGAGRAGRLWDRLKYIQVTMGSRGRRWCGSSSHGAF